MYVLDTNVISELRKLKRVDRAVLRWLESVPIEAQYLSAISIFEVELGIIKAERTNNEEAIAYKTWLNRKVLPSFAGRILPLNEKIAVVFARMMAPKTRPYRDAIIAATAQHHGYAVVTRNVRDFVELPVRVINPWEFT
jgi:predicted nucleic acid-binding protein